MARSPALHLSRAESKRFWAKVNKRSGIFAMVGGRYTECWVWTGTTTRDGYAHFWRGGKHVKASRLSYELVYGQIAPGYEPDHLCRTRSCIQPSHMEAVTKRVNILRGVGPTAVNARKTHCLRGHPFSGTNVIVRSGGRRECRTCYEDRNARRRRKTLEGERRRIEKVRAFYRSLSPEERRRRVHRLPQEVEIKRIKSIRNFYASLMPEEKAERTAHLRSLEVIQRRMANLKDYFTSLTPQERLARGRALVARRQRKEGPDAKRLDAH